MTDKVQKIREVIEKRYECWREKELNSHSIESEIRMSECQHLLLMLDSLQEEPVSDELEGASKEWLAPQLDKSYTNYGEAKMMELTHFDGYAMLDAIEFGANWYKKQMIKDAYEREVKVDAGGYPYIPQMELYDYDKDIPLAKEGDRYKVILIKEE